MNIGLVFYSLYMIMIISLYCIALIISVGFWAFNYASLWMFGDGESLLFLIIVMDGISEFIQHNPSC